MYYEKALQDLAAQDSRLDTVPGETLQHLTQGEGWMDTNPANKLSTDYSPEQLLRLTNQKQHLLSRYQSPSG